MLEKVIRVPDAAYPITIERSLRRVVVKAAGKVLAESGRALELKESGRSAVLYIPRKDVHLDSLERSPTASYCPYKGDAQHYDIAAANARIANACWSYNEPHWAVAEIEKHIAFDPDLIDCLEQP